MIPISKPIIKEDEINAVINVLKSGIIAAGPKVKEFENKLSQYFDVKNAIAVSNGTCALHGSLFGLGIGKGDKVITTPFTFIATANSILHANAEPVFVDIEEDSFNINPDEIEILLKKDKNKKIKAIIVVHLYGKVCNMDKILKIAKKYEVKVIEDAAQAHGAKLKGKLAGTFGDIAAFSLYATKNITSAEGGFILTRNDRVAKRIRSFINHGQERIYYHTMIGYNYRMTDIEAALGIEQLKKLDLFNSKRRENANKLNEILSKFDFMILPKENKEDFHVYHQYTVRVKKGLRDNLIKFLNENGIGAKIFYPIPIHKQPFYKKIIKEKVSLPVSEKIAKEVISLPVHPELDNEYFEFLKKLLEKFSRSI